MLAALVGFVLFFFLFTLAPSTTNYAHSHFENGINMMKENKLQFIESGSPSITIASDYSLGICVWHVKDFAACRLQLGLPKYTFL